MSINFRSRLCLCRGGLIRDVAWHLLPTIVLALGLLAILIWRPETPLRLFRGDKEFREYSTFVELREAIRENYYRTDYDDDSLFHSSMRGAVEALDDRYSAYLEPKELEENNKDISGQFAGIGITLTLGDDGFPTVTTPYPGTPAMRAGLKPGDKFIRINGDDPRGLDFHEGIIRARLMGPENTVVKLRVRSRDGTERDVEITRARVKIPSVFTKPLDDPRATTHHVGYLRITRFQNETADDVLAAAKRLKAEGVSTLILDVRGNPGGQLHEVCLLVGLFLKPTSLIVSLWGPSPDFRREFRADHPQAEALGDLGVVLLVDRDSASASEILAGALKDHQRGLLVGETTYGKGLVQNVYRLSADRKTGVRLTTAQYFTPSGRCIQRSFQYRTCPTCKANYVATDRMRYCSVDGAKLNDDFAHGKAFRGGVLPDIALELGDHERLLMKLALNEIGIFNGPPWREGQAKLLDKEPFVDRMLDAALNVIAGHPVAQSQPTNVAAASSLEE